MISSSLNGAHTVKYQHILITLCFNAIQLVFHIIINKNNFHSREQLADTQIAPLGEWQLFRYNKLFSLISDSVGNEEIDVRDFVNVLVRRYADSRFAGCESEEMQKSIVKMESAITAFYSDLMDHAEEFKTSCGKNRHLGCAMSKHMLRREEFLCSMQHLMMTREYDDGLPNSINNLIDARFELMLAGQSLHKEEAKIDTQQKLSKEEFIYEYEKTRNWSGESDDFLYTAESPTVTLLFEEAITTLKRNIEDKDFGEIDNTQISKAQWVAFQRRWWCSNDVWDELNSFP